MDFHRGPRRRAFLIALGGLISACGSLSEIANSGGHVFRALGRRGGDSGPRETAGTQTALPSNQRACKAIEFHSKKDVDALYASAMQVFGFRTIAEREFDARRIRGLIDEGFKHRAVPGALYDMTDYVFGPSGQRQGGWMNLRISKQTDEGTLVAAAICLPPPPYDTVKLQYYEQALRTITQ